MTGAVASQSVTEAPKGSLSAARNRAQSAKAEGSLTASRTGRAGTKVGLSDPVASRWKGHRSTDKSYPGDNRLISPKSSYRHIDGEVWHLDVGSSHPGAEVGPKGWAVRPLKWYVSWVQNVVRQFGPYPSRAQEICGDLLLVREDRSGRINGVPIMPPGVPLGSYIRAG